MKDIKNKEIIIGLIALIILSIVAICLIIKRETPKEARTVKELSIEAASYMEDAEADMNGMGSDISADAYNELEGLALAEEKSDVAVAAAKNVKDNLAIYPKEPKEFLVEPVMKEYTGDELWQLEEIYHYWDEYKLEAVNDLISLPRVRTLTNELSGTNNFYYFGGTDSKGKPSGTGIAVYADNAYYFGSWKDGKRSGSGMYWKIYPDKTGSLNGVSGVIEHIYNGNWLNDYPNGEGQEHITYDCDFIDGDYIIANVIGTFKDGYYDGELYIMTIDDEGDTTDWEAEASAGTFKYYDKTYSAMGRRKVWKLIKEEEALGDDNFAWIYEKENVNYGIFGLKKAVQ